MHFSVSSRNNVRYSLQDIRVNVCADQWLSGRESFSDFFFIIFAGSIIRFLYLFDFFIFLYYYARNSLIFVIFRVIHSTYHVR